MPFDASSAKILLIVPRREPCNYLFTKLKKEVGLHLTSKVERCNLDTLETNLPKLEGKPGNKED